jgi:uncharacterized glyoxalase superfamily protein PhnB
MPQGKPPVLEAVTPILSVTDLSVALDFYKRVLEFETEWEWGDPPRLAGLCRDRIAVNLTQSSDAIVPTSKVYFETVGVDAFYDHLVASGAVILEPIADRHYGMRDFKIVDPSGNELSFGEANS